MKTILLVDDEKDFLEIFTRVLKKEGYRVVTAASGPEALRKASSVKPDVVVTDLAMDTPDAGFWLAERIKSEPGLKGVRILLVSGIVRRKQGPASGEPGDPWFYIDDFLEKPFAPAVLVKHVQALTG
ncbi:response regulator [bacterium]|nr:response regulator [bacterium]